MATYWENSCSFGLRYVSWYKYLIVSLVFSHLGFWSGNLFLIAPFPDLCLLVPFSTKGWTCEWVNITDGDGGPVSCIYIRIDLEEETLFTARLFLKTHLITFQGNRLNEWCDWEFPILKQAVDNLHV